jgi:hypothetical protein
MKLLPDGVFTMTRPALRGHAGVGRTRPSSKPPDHTRRTGAAGSTAGTVSGMTSRHPATVEVGRAHPYRLDYYRGHEPGPRSSLPRTRLIEPDRPLGLHPSSPRSAEAPRNDGDHAEHTLGAINVQVAGLASRSRSRPSL